MEKNFEHIQDLLQKALVNNAKLKKVVDRFEIKQIIEETIGESIMRYIQDIQIQDNSILIKTVQSVLRQEIKSQESVLLDQINTALGKQQFFSIHVVQ